MKHKKIAKSAKPRLIAAGRLPAATLDKTGLTFGSLSGLAYVPDSAKRNARGELEFLLKSVPDRGFNVPEENRFSDYEARLNTIKARIEPDSLVLALSLADTQILKDGDGKSFTGLDPNKGRAKMFGATLPSPERGQAKGRLSVDCEGLALGKDGWAYVSDEYSCGIYVFDPMGRAHGYIPMPPCCTPRLKGKRHYTSRSEPTQGRSRNEGPEGISVSPDGKTLIALMQGALVQDRGHKSVAKRFVRLFVFDIAKERAPQNPIGHHIVELPTFKLPGKSGGKRVVEVNDVLALDDGRFLALVNDGRGVSDKASTKPVYKRILIGGYAEAQNLIGTKYDQDAKPVAPNGKLKPKFKPIALDTYIDLLDQKALKGVGLKVRQLSEKWESLTLVPACDPKAPNAQFLLAGNDNDFAAPIIRMPGHTFKGDGEVDTMILVWSIPDGLTSWPR